MEDFHFQNQQILPWALALVPALVCLAWYTRNHAQNRLARFAEKTALQRLLRGGGKRPFLSARNLAFYASLCCLILAWARPQGNPVYEEHDSVGLDIMVLLDVSRSMDAEDIYPSRLKKAKREINTLLDHLSGDRVGIVAFAGSAALMAPLTSDYEVVRSYLESIDSSTIQNQGTNISQGLDVALQAFERGGQNGLAPEEKSNLVLLLSDGEANAGSSYDAVEKIHKQGITIYTIAFGTEKGVPIPIRDPRGDLLSYKRNKRGDNVITKVEPKALKEIASHGGGIFYFATLDEGEISDILAHTQSLQRSTKSEIKTRVYEEYFFYFLAMGIALLLLSFIPMRKNTAAVIFLLLFSSRAFADPLQSALWDKNRRLSEGALREFQAGKFSDSTEILKSLQVDNPNSPIVSYDLGTSLLKEKKYEEGRAVLSEAEKSAGIPGLAARMNLAGSYAEEKKTVEAQSAYSSIVHELASQEKLSRAERELLALAKKNLELLSPEEQKKQQQKQQQQQQNQQKQQDQEKQQGQQNQDQQKSQNQSGQNDKDKEKPKPEQKPEEQKQYDHHRQPFQERQDMSEQDAKRMLEALKQQESAVQKKFLKKLGNDKKPRDDENDQDW